MARWRPGILVLAILVGCRADSSSPPADLQPVKGRIVDAGTAVKGGGIAFHAVEDPAPLPINADVDDDGRFELATVHDRKRLPGAPPGKYRIVYSPANMEIGKSEPITLAETVEIAAGGAELTLDISRKE
jgi:hypothetical protein